MARRVLRVPRRAAASSDDRPTTAPPAPEPGSGEARIARPGSGPSAPEGASTGSRRPDAAPDSSAIAPEAGAEPGEHPVTVATSGPSGDLHEVSALTERAVTERAVTERAAAVARDAHEVPGGTGATADGAPPDAAGELLVPPDDPEDWSDDQWLAWLGQGDDVSEVDEATAPRVQRSAGGQILGNAMLGLAEAMYGQKRPEIVVEADAPGDPMGDDLQLYLDPDHPEDSVVVVRRSRPRGGPPASPAAGP